MTEGTSPAVDRSLVVWVLLSLAMVAALCSTGFLPFYDYYQWLFQGHVVSVLLFGAAGSAHDVAGSYYLSPVPVPNLAAPVLIGLLNTFLSIEVAGRVFVVATVLGVAGAYGRLVRTLQRRPTTIEYLGLLWAPGFFLYKGYLSFAVGLAAVFLLVAVLHRLVDDPTPPPRRGLLVVTGLGVLLYLSHLLTWIMGGLAVLAHAVVLLRRGQRPAAAQLVATMIPGVALATWYVIAEHGGSGVTFYPSWREKAIALTETLQPFLRLDPFPPAFPLFWVNIVLALVSCTVVAAHVDVGRLRTAVVDRPVLWLSLALAAIALLLPISTVNDLIKPDERFVMPALLLATAALPLRGVGKRLAALGPILAVVVIALHLVEYTAVDRRIAHVDAAIDATVPPDTSVLHVVIPSRYGCGDSPGPVTGVPALKWFAVDHALEAGPTRVNVEETSLVHARASASPQTTVLALDVPQVSAEVLPAAVAYPFVDAIGCPSDLIEVEHDLSPRYRPDARGDGYTILERSR